MGEDGGGIKKDFRNLKIPKDEKLEVQLLDGTKEHNICHIITSLARIRGDKIVKNFKLYKVNDDSTLEFLEKKDSSPEFSIS